LEGQLGQAQKPHEYWENSAWLLKRRAQNPSKTAKTGLPLKMSLGGTTGQELPGAAACFFGN
jgi:hypothetical protein